ASAYSNSASVWVGPDQSGGTAIYGQSYATPSLIEAETETLYSGASPDPIETMTVESTVSVVGGSYLWEYRIHNNDFLGGNNNPPDGLLMGFNTAGVYNVSGSGTVNPAGD